MMDLDVLGSAPIAGDNPAGSDVRGGAEFEALQTEIDRPNDTANPGQTDWGKVVKLSTEITASQGKDLLVASYLAVGLMKQRQVDGFAQGLKVLRDMILTHWDGLFPPAKRMRGRRNALQYWLDQCDEILRTVSTAPLEQSQIDAMLEQVDEIDAVLREKDDEPPGVFRLSGLIKGFPVRVEEVPPDPASAVPGDGGDASSSTGGGELVPPSTYDEALALVDRGFAALRMAGDYLLDAELNNPLPYRISRWAAWSGIAELPYADGGMTMLPAPEWHIVESFASLQSAGQHEAMLRFVEGLLPEAPLWLDLNRAQALSLQALGESFAAAAAAVRLETALLVTRLPGVERLRFSDGTPFASAETVAWLAAATSTDANAGTASGSDSGVARELREAMEKSAVAVGQGDIAAAVAILQRGIDRAPLARDRYQGRVCLVTCLIEQQVVANPWPYVRGLLEEIDRHGLDDWDPALALSGLRLVYSGIIAAGEAAAGAPNADDILERIARIDCVQALQLSGLQ